MSSNKLVLVMDEWEQKRLFEMRRKSWSKLDAKLEIRSREEMLKRESSTSGRIEYLKKLVSVRNSHAISTAEEMRG